MYHDAATSEEKRPLTQEDTPTHGPTQMMVTPAVSENVFYFFRCKFFCHQCWLLWVDITFIWQCIHLFILLLKLYMCVVNIFNEILPNWQSIFSVLSIEILYFFVCSFFFRNLMSTFYIFYLTCTFKWTFFVFSALNKCSSYSQGPWRYHLLVLQTKLFKLFTYLYPPI